MKNNIEFIPLYYTQREGGIWRKWPYSFNMSEESLSFYRQIQKNGQVRILKRPPIHSIKFKGGKEWDCINGWRS